VLVPLPEPVLTAARAVFNLPEPIQRRPDQDEIFIAAVREEFPTVAARQYLPPETPMVVPHLVVQSTASRAAVSAVGCEFETRFYGEYREDRERCFDYLRRKLRALLAGWEAVGSRPSFFGLILNGNVSFTNEEMTPAQYIIDHHLRSDADPDLVQDAVVKIALRHAERFFVTVQLANYEIKDVERPMFPGQQIIQVRPWEGRIQDVGIEISVDVNNRLESIVREHDPEVGEEDLLTITHLVERVMTRARASFIETGTLNIDELTMETA
jgi:hypothetical protein